MLALRPWLICNVVFVSTLLFEVQAESTARSLRIIERGIYRAETVSRLPTPGTTGVINTVQNTSLVSGTTSVPGLIGVRFGFRYLVGGKADETDALLRFIIRFPAGGLRVPATRQIILQSEHTTRVPVRASLYWEYHFENDWEIVGGIWQFEVWEGSVKLGEQRFCVYTQSLKSSAPAPSECRADLLG